MNTNKTLAAVACIFIFAGIAFGAFGAHWLKTLISAHYLQTFDTGVRYQIYAGLGLLILSVSGLNAKWAFRFILFGAIVFSFSLYLLALNELISSQFKIFGAIAPLGGLSMLLGWGMAAYQFLKNKSH